jgi:phage terminase small subunit
MGKSKTPELTSKRLQRAQLSIKQQRFVKEYADLGNGTEAARRAGYKDGSAIAAQAYENLNKPHVQAAVQQELARIAVEVTPMRVQRRLDAISHAAEAEGQFGPAVRAEELIGKSIGMWVDQSIQLTGQLSGSHVAALLEIARQRREQPIDLVDDQVGHADGHSDYEDR